MQFKRMRLLLLGLALFAGTTLLHLVGNAPTPDEGPDAYAAADDLEGPGTVPIAIEGPGRLPASAEASATSPSAKPAAAQNPTRHPTPNPVPVRDGTSAPPPSQISSTYLDPFRGKLGNNNGGKTHDAGGSAGQPTSPAAARAQVRKALRARAKAMAGGGGGAGRAWEKEFTKAAKEKATADRNAAKRTAAESFFYSDHSDHSTSMIGQLTKPNLGGGAALSDGAWRERALPKNADPEAMPKNANVVVVAWSEVFHETRAAQANLAVAPAINWFVTWSGDRFVVPSKMRLSLMSFAVAYPTATISIYTNNEPSSAMEELRKADLLTPIPGAGSLLSWAGGNGRLRIVPYKLRNLVSDCAKEVGIPDDETLSRRLRSPFFLKYTSEADLVRSCVTYLIGGIYFDTDVIWLQPWPVEWLEQPTIVVDAASTLSEVQPGTLEYTKWGAEFVDLKGWSVRHAAGTAATAELITDGMEPYYVQNGIFIMPRAHERFMKTATIFCMSRDHDEECWNCCGPRAFSHALADAYKTRSYGGYNEHVSNKQPNTLALLHNTETFKCSMAFEASRGAKALWRAPRGTALDSSMNTMMLTWLQLDRVAQG